MIFACSFERLLGCSPSLLCEGGPGFFGVETRLDPRALGGLQVPGHPADEVEPTADELPPIMSDRAQTALGDAPGRCLRSVPKAVGKRTACWKNLSQTWPRARFPTSHI